jgi:hypothetical protein
MYCPEKRHIFVDPHATRRLHDLCRVDGCQQRFGDGPRQQLCQYDPDRRWQPDHSHANPIAVTFPHTVADAIAHTDAAAHSHSDCFTDGNAITGGISHA